MRQALVGGRPGETSVLVIGFAMLGFIDHETPAIAVVSIIAARADKRRKGTPAARVHKATACEKLARRFEGCAG